jgi:hypothetical protein
LDEQMQGKYDEHKGKDVGPDTIEDFQKIDWIIGIIAGLDNVQKETSDTKGKIRGGYHGVLCCDDDRCWRVLRFALTESVLASAGASLVLSPIFLTVEHAFRVARLSDCQ